MLEGLKGIHCCGNTDWSLVLETGIDILSFDAYKYGSAVGVYAQNMAKLVQNGGAIAWGIVPNSEEEMASETLASLQDRLEELMLQLSKIGEIPFNKIVSASLITPSCSLTPLSEEGAEQALALLTRLSANMQKKHL